MGAVGASPQSALSSSSISYQLIPRSSSRFCEWLEDVCGGWSGSCQKGGRRTSARCFCVEEFVSFSMHFRHGMKSFLMIGSLMNGLLGFRDRTKSADRLDVDAKKHSLHRRNQRSIACSRQRDSPPFRALRRQSFPRMFPLRGVVLRHIQFQEVPVTTTLVQFDRLPISSACRQTFGFFRIHSIFLPKVEKM